MGIIVSEHQSLPCNCEDECLKVVYLKNKRVGYFQTIHKNSILFTINPTFCGIISYKLIPFERTPILLDNTVNEQSTIFQLYLFIYTILLNMCKCNIGRLLV